MFVLGPFSLFDSSIANIEKSGLHIWPSTKESGWNLLQKIVHQQLGWHRRGDSCFLKNSSHSKVCPYVKGTRTEAYGFPSQAECHPCLQILLMKHLQTWSPTRTWTFSILPQTVKFENIKLVPEHKVRYIFHCSHNATGSGFNLINIKKNDTEMHVK